MKLFKNLLILFLILGIAFAFASCNTVNDGNSVTSTSAGSEDDADIFAEDDIPFGEAVAYSVTVKTAGGMSLADVHTYIYAGEEMIDYVKTDSDGFVSFKLPKASNYEVVLSGLPEGYEVAESYALNSYNIKIALSSSLITDEDISQASFKLGSVMYDFTVEGIDGTEIKLSDILKDKKLVVLNFWYSSCAPWLSEYPVLSEVYEDYKDDVEIIALNNLVMDRSLEDVENFLNENDLPFPVATCDDSWGTAFGIAGYPTSVYIDRYGVICAYEVGAVTNKTPLIGAFDYFTADGYVQKLLPGGISDIINEP